MAATISDTDRVALIEEMSEICRRAELLALLKRGRVVSLWRFTPRRLTRIAASSVPRCAPSRSHHRRRSARRGRVRPAAGAQHVAPRQWDDYPCASADQLLRRLAHYGVDFRTRGLSTWKCPRDDRVRDQYGRARSAPPMRRRGIDCHDRSGVRLRFTGRIRVTVTVGLQVAGTCEGEDRCLRHRQEETRHPRWERCAAPVGAIERTLYYQVFSANAALHSAAPFPEVTTTSGRSQETRLTRSVGGSRRSPRVRSSYAPGAHLIHRSRSARRALPIAQDEEAVDADAANGRTNAPEAAGNLAQNARFPRASTAIPLSSEEKNAEDYADACSDLAFQVSADRRARRSSTMPRSSRTVAGAHQRARRQAHC